MKALSKRSIIAAAVIYNSDKKILLTKRSSTQKDFPNIWSITSGKLNIGESFHQGLLREIKEELDIKVKIQFPIYTWHRKFEKINEEYLGVTFLCKYISGDVTLDNIEEIAFRWVDIKTAKLMITDQQILENVMQAEYFLKIFAE